jgi:hypothetical protein
MFRKMLAGSTSESVPIFVRNSSVTTGAGLSGLTSATSGLVAEYRRQGQSSFTAITLSAGTLGTWSSGGFVAAGSLAGRYELGVPNAAIAPGAEWVEIWLSGAANMVPTGVFIELDAVNYQSNTAFVASVPAVVGSVGSVTAGFTLPLNQNIPIAGQFTPGPTATQNLGQVLNAIMALAAGSEAWNGTAYTRFNVDGSTFRTFVTNAAAPTGGTAPTSLT